MKFIMTWQSVANIPAIKFKCGYCGENVASDKGYHSLNPLNKDNAYIYICPYCKNPTYINPNDLQFPGPPFGKEIDYIEDDDIKYLYWESREAFKNCCYTASVLCCRKLIMNIAVNKGAEENKNFIYYVEYLSNKGYVPPDGKEWVDHIRKKGNEATHEIQKMSAEDSQELLGFIEMLLIFIFEFPGRIKKK